MTTWFNEIFNGFFYSSLVLDFWNKSFDFRYEQTVEDPFHISKACIEPTTGKGNITSVYVECNDEEFIVCNLNDKILNETLDLNFNAGDKIVFKTSVIILWSFIFWIYLREISRFTKSFLHFFSIVRFWRDLFYVSYQFASLWKTRKFSKLLKQPNMWNTLPCIPSAKDRSTTKNSVRDLELNLSKTETKAIESYKIKLWCVGTP